MITNHAIYKCRGTTSTVSFICKSRTNKTGSTSIDIIEAVGNKGQ